MNPSSFGIFEVFESGTNKLWYFHLKAVNGEVVAASEGYHNRTDIVRLYSKYFPNWEWRESVRDTADARSTTNEIAEESPSEH